MWGNPGCGFIFSNNCSLVLIFSSSYSLVKCSLFLEIFVDISFGCLCRDPVYVLLLCYSVFLGHFLSLLELSVLLLRFSEDLCCMFPNYGINFASFSVALILLMKRPNSNGHLKNLSSPQNGSSRK